MRRQCSCLTVRPPSDSDDIEVRFFEVRDNRLHWEAFGEFLPADVHKQVAICFKTPRYATLEVSRLPVVDETAPEALPQEKPIYL